MVLDDRVKGLLDGRPFAVLATLNQTERRRPR